MPPEARYVVTDAAPAGQAAVLDGQRAVDVDGLATVGDEEGEQAVAKGGVVARIVGAALTLAAFAAATVVAFAQDAAAGAAALGLVGGGGHSAPAPIST